MTIPEPVVPVEPVVPAAPPAEPVAPPAPPAAPPAEPAAPPATAAPAAQLTEDQWKALEKETGIPRGQIILQQAQVNAALTAGPVGKLLEDQAMSVVKLNPDRKDFSKYEEEIKARLAKLQPHLRQDPKIVEEVYFLVKGQSFSKPAGAGAATPPAGGRRVVVSPTGGGEPEPQPGDNAGLDGLTPFEQHVAGKYGIKSTKEMKENTSRNLDTSNEYDWKPKF